MITPSSTNGKMRDNHYLVKTLLDHGANPETAKDPLGFTLLHYAAALDHLKTVRILMEHHVNTDVASPDNITPLAFAQQNSMQCLIEHGATIDAKRTDGTTPL